MPIGSGRNRFQYQSHLLESIVGLMTSRGPCGSCESERLLLFQLDPHFGHLISEMTRWLIPLEGGRGIGILTLDTRVLNAVARCGPPIEHKTNKQQHLVILRDTLRYLINTMMFYDILLYSLYLLILGHIVCVIHISQYF